MGRGETMGGEGVYLSVHGRYCFIGGGRRRDKEYDGKARRIFRQEGIGIEYWKDKNNEIQEGSWKKMGREVEEVREFRYLGYTLQGNGGQEVHVKERVRKAAAMMKQEWEIEKRRFRKDWGRRLWLFDRLV